MSRWGALLALLAVAVVTLVGAPFDRLALPLLYLGVALHVTDDRAHGG